MNHPTREQWMAYLYDELPSAEHAELKAHASTCAECDAQLVSWRDAGTKLDQWKLSAPPRRSLVWRHPLKWGIAAMLMIGFGIGLARWTAPTVDTAQIEKSLRAEFQQQLATARAADKELFATWLAESEKQRATDYATLRADLDTVAVTAEGSLRQAQRQIGQLRLVAQSGNDSTQNFR